MSGIDELDDLLADLEQKKPATSSHYQGSSERFVFLTYKLRVQLTSVNSMTLLTLWTSNTFACIIFFLLFFSNAIFVSFVASAVLAAISHRQEQEEEIFELKLKRRCAQLWPQGFGRRGMRKKKHTRSKHSTKCSKKF
jgi:hypothetical protein